MAEINSLKGEVYYARGRLVQSGLSEYNHVTALVQLEASMCRATS